LSARTTRAGAVALIASVLLLASLFFSWYNISLSTSNGSQSVAVNFYPGQAFNTSTTSGSSTSASTTTYSEAKLPQTGELYMVLEILLVLGSVLGVTGASLLLAAGNDSPSVKSWGTTLVVFVVLMALIGPVMLWVGQPSALANDSYKGTTANSQTNSPMSSFFGSNSTSAYTANWGPSIGWYLSILAFVMLAISVALVPGSRPGSEAIPEPATWDNQRAYGSNGGSSESRYTQSPSVVQPPNGRNYQAPGSGYSSQLPPTPAPPPPRFQPVGFCTQCGAPRGAGAATCFNCGATFPPSRR
jgi:hypothetical protein